MPKQSLICGVLLSCVCAAIAQTDKSPPAVAAASTEQSINCRAMETFVAEEAGATAVLFHQRDRADGPLVGEFILAHSGERVEFETADGKRHRATLFRLKSCFGRGLLLFPSSETKLAENDDFVLRFPGRN